MIRPALALAACLSFGLPCSVAQAAGSVQLGWIFDATIGFDDDDGESVDFDGDGLSVQASYGILRGLFAFGDWYERSVEFEDTGVDFDFSTRRLGIGTGSSRGALAFWGALNWEQAKVDFGGESETDSGFGLRGGASFRLNEAAFLYGEAGYADIGDSSGSDFAFGLGLYVSERVALLADYRLQRFEDDGAGSKLDITDIRLGLNIDLP